MDNLKRQGFFDVNEMFINDGSIPELIKAMDFVPLSFFRLADSGSYRMLGTSPLFEEIGDAACPAKYEVFVQSKANRAKTSIAKVTAKRIT